MNFLKIILDVIWYYSNKKIVTIIIISSDLVLNPLPIKLSTAI